MVFLLDIMTIMGLDTALEVARIQFPHVKKKAIEYLLLSRANHYGRDYGPLRLDGRPRIIDGPTNQ